VQSAKRCYFYSNQKSLYLNNNIHILTKNYLYLSRFDIVVLSATTILNVQGFFSQVSVGNLIFKIYIGQSFLNGVVWRDGVFEAAQVQTLTS